MPKSVPLLPPGFEQLSIAKKLDYVQSLWDVIALAADDVPVPQWHKKLVRERLRARRLRREATSPWDEVRTRIKKRLAACRRRR